MIGIGGGASTGYMPSYASSVHDFFPSRSVYNSDSPALHKIRASLNLSPGVLKEWAVIGTSLSIGANGNGNTQDSEQAVPAMLLKYLVAANIGYVDGGWGVRPCVSIAAGPLASGWSSTGAFNTTTAPYAFTTNGGTLTYVAPRTVTQVKVTYFDAVATTTPWTINGVAQTVIPAGASNTWKVFSPGAVGIAAGQSIVFSPGAGNSFYCHDVSGVNAAGLVIHNLGMGGGRATGGSNIVNFTSGSGVGTLQTVRQGSLFGRTIDVLWIELGVNDVLNNVTPSAIIAAIQQIIAWSQFTGAVPVLVATWRSPAVTDIAWNAYLAQLYLLADLLNCPLFDWNDRLQGQTTAQADGMLGPDNLHENWPCQAAAGKAQYDWLVS